MLGFKRVNVRHPRPRRYVIGPFAGPAAAASTFKRGGIILTGGQGTETVTGATISLNTISTGATVDVAANANATVVTVTAGGDTIASSTNAAADTADGAAMTLGAAADLIRSEGDVLLVTVATAAGGEATQLVDFCVIVETQPTI